MFLKGLLIFSFFLEACYCQLSGNVTIVTIPSRLTGQSKVFVSADYGQEISVSCTAYRLGSDTVLLNEWILLDSNNNVIPLNFNDTTGISEEFPSIYSTADDDLLHNITISNFTADLNRASLVCQPQGQGIVLNETFVFGIPIPPTLITGELLVNQTEGSINFTQNLASGDNDPFPPYVTSQWTYNGQIITSTGNIMLSDYAIFFPSVQRNQNGTYRLMIGSVNASFMLNVQYQPEGVPVNNTVIYGILGQNITLTFFTSLDGNPSPYTSWTINGTGIMIGGRYQSIDPTQLLITNMTSNDIGTYIASASNGIGSDLTASVQLIQARQPGSPTNLTASDVTHNSVYLSWNEPNDAGSPPLTHYIVTISPPAPSGSLYVTMATRYAFFNLLPVTNYSVTVAAVSSVFLSGGLPSNIITLYTTDGPPEFASTDFISSSSGNITIAWQLRHTGGYPYNELSARAFCSADMDFMLSSGSGTLDTGSAVAFDTFIYSCSSNCINANTLSGSTMLGAVTAGTTYYCSVIVSNVFADVSSNENIIPVYGKPSKPILAVATSPGLVSLTVRCTHSGISLGNTFSFNVTVMDRQGSDNIVQSYSYNNYVNDTNRTINITVTGGLVYDIEVLAINQYGQSERAMAGPVNVTISTLPPTTTEPTGGSRLLIIIIGAAVGGLLIAVCVISVSICICACCYRRSRKKRTWEVQTTRAETWKRGSVEMSQRKRH